MKHRHMDAVIIVALMGCSAWIGQAWPATTEDGRRPVARIVDKKPRRGGFVISSPEPVPWVWRQLYGLPFTFIADAKGGAHAGDTMTVVVKVGALRYSEEALAKIHLKLPRTLRLVAGETATVGPLRTVVGNHTLRLLPQQPGKFDILGELHVDDGQQQDDAAFVMPVTVRSDTAFAEDSHYTRLETRRGGQRFRCGGRFLVPLDGAEPPATERLLRLQGTRARVTHLASASCRGCSDRTGVDSVLFVVIVGPNGKVRDSRQLPVWRWATNPSVVTAAQVALQRSRFRAASLNHSRVSDLIYVAVPVRVRP